MKFLRRLFRLPAILIVTLWARMAYEKGVLAAEERHQRSGHTIYLAANSFRPDRLVTYDKAQFKTEKRVYGVAARLLTMNTLKRGCFYYTKDRFGRDGMTAREKEIRKRAFIKDRLRMAGLLGKV